jgi:hypothetical protein
MFDTCILNMKKSTIITVVVVVIVIIIGLLILNPFSFIMKQTGGGNTEGCVERAKEISVEEDDDPLFGSVETRPTDTQNEVIYI